MMAGLVLTTSCSDDLLDERGQDSSQNRISSFQELESKMSDKERLKVKFARKLALAVSENADLRMFLKTEALKMINNDYDVFYPVIKDKSIYGNLKSSSNPSSFRNTLLPYFENESELNEIEQQLPLLTIFIPELPENSFSAATWDTTDPASNPVVAIRLSSSNDVPAIDIFHREDYVIESDLIPSYPVIVVKDNERIRLSNGSSTAKNLNPQPCSQELSLMSYEFTDNNFNPCVTYSFGGGSSGPSNPQPCNPGFKYIPGRDNTVNQYLIDAYNVFNGSITDPWHRDNIYYQLTPTQTEGVFVGGRYVEAVTYFKLAGDPVDLFNGISDQTSETGDNDPSNANHDWDHDARNRTPWTDGKFEIEIIIVDNSKSRNVVTTPRVIDARPEMLFEYGQETVVRMRGAWPVRWQRTYWRPIITGLKGMDLMSTQLGSQNAHVNPWDLKNYSNTWTYRFSEQDNPVEITDVTNASRKYNQNFEFSLAFGQEVKKGLKLGASTEESTSTARTYKFTEGSDRLGEVDVHIYDRILNLNPCDGKLYPKLYSNSRVEVEIRPVQVEF